MSSWTLNSDIFHAAISRTSCRNAGGRPLGSEGDNGKVLLDEIISSLCLFPSDGADRYGICFAVALILCYCSSEHSRNVVPCLQSVYFVAQGDTTENCLFLIFVTFLLVCLFFIYIAK